jgi:hypothetical protein
MSYLITAFVFTLVGFAAGFLVFRKNQARINDAEAKARDLLK